MTLQKLFDTLKTSHTHTHEHTHTFNMRRLCMLPPHTSTHTHTYASTHSDTIVTYLPSLVLKVTLNGFKGFGLGAPSLPTSALHVHPRALNEGLGGMRGPRCSRFLLQHPQHFCSAFDFLFVASAARSTPVQSTQSSLVVLCPEQVAFYAVVGIPRSWGAGVVAFVSKFACDVTNF